MKFFTVIFSFYLLGLSCLPCADIDECTVKSDAAISAPANHDKHSQDTEHCTPFCTCSCCAGTVVVERITSFITPKNIFCPEKYPFFDISYSGQISFSIWQPPKLS